MKLKSLLIACFFISILHSQITVTISGLSPSCVLPCNGFLSFTALGGTPPYIFTLLPSAQSNSTGIFNNVCAGSFTVTVVDAVGGSTTYSSSLPAINAPLITSVSQTPINPPFNYRAQVNYTGGQARYFITWITMPFQTNIRMDTVSTMNDTLSGLSPGDYGVFVTDSTNVNSNCIGNTAPFLFSICDPAVGLGDISVSPNDTVCSGEAITVTYTPIMFGPAFPISQIFTSDNPNCDPSASSGIYSCNITQTTTFSGFWFYAMGCQPIMYPPITITVLPCVGINEHQKENAVSIFPNPGNGIFTVKTDQVNAVQLDIYDETGRNCFSAIAKDGDEINSNLNSGIYFIRFTSEAGVKTEKLVVTNK